MILNLEALHLDEAKVSSSGSPPPALRTRVATGGTKLIHSLKDFFFFFKAEPFLRARSVGKGTGRYGFPDVRRVPTERITGLCSSHPQASKTASANRLGSSTSLS